LSAINTLNSKLSIAAFYNIPKSVKFTIPKQQKWKLEGTFHQEKVEQASHPTGARNNSRKQ
jgi:hypothetical protein